MDYLFWILLVASFVIFTYLMKILFKAKTWYIFSMVKSKKLSNLLDYLKNKRIWDFIGTSGVFLGFGLVGVLYWFKRETKKIILYQLLVTLVSLVLGYFFYMQFGIIYGIILFLVTFIFGLSGFSIASLVVVSIDIISRYFSGLSSCPGIAPVIPGVQIPGVPILIPFFEGWLALISILIIHEAAHGILAKIIGIKVKSFGLLLLGFFPIGAFTEPDEVKLQKSKPKDKLKVYASGPSSNFYTAIIAGVILLLVSIFSAGYMATIATDSFDGVKITSVGERTGICSEGVSNLNYGVIDENYSKVVLADFNDVNSLSSFSQILESSSDKEYITLRLENNQNEQKDYNLHYNSDGKLGINFMSMQDDSEITILYKIISFILVTIGWFVLLSITICIFNFLPAGPFDGGHMTKIISSKYLGLKGYKILRLVLIISLLVIVLVNILPYFF